ncbi:HAD family hydrolase [Paenibacillus bovis]|uniref:Hydrolase n=1 Tax=Paenibacillus bovis TaxID=1616788 RepID=A0A172ZDL6_9BACL|nr:HAD family hydrolase [Paenibacillus bovis]ANF95619.1 hydrolase [Paenibacillus bovis]
MNLLLDVDDTLYDQLTPFTDAYQSVFGPLHYDCRVEDVFARNRWYSDEVFEQVRSGQMSEPDMHVYRITRAMEDMNIRISVEQARAFQDSYADQQQRLVLDPQMEELLDFAVQAGIRLGIITNGPAEHQARKVQQLRMNRWVDEQNVFISGKLGVAKPDTRIFRHVEQSMQIVPEQSCYIGDSYANDIIGAKKAGWLAIWINRRNQPMPDNTPYVPDDIVKKGRTPLDALKELYTILGYV